MYRPSHITVGETELKAVQQFAYLGCTISSDAKIDKEIGKGNSAFRQTLQSWLEQQALEESHKNQHLQSRGTAYPPVWLRDVGHYSHHLRLLERFHQRCLRSILNIHWSDYVTIVEVLQQAGITSIEATLLKTQLH